MRILKNYDFIRTLIILHVSNTHFEGVLHQINLINEFSKLHNACTVHWKSITDYFVGSLGRMFSRLGINLR